MDRGITSWRRPASDWGFVAAIVVIVVAIFAQSYNGRRDVVMADRAQCHRQMAIREANMEAWYAAYLARRDDYRRTHREQDRQSAAAYFIEVKVALAQVDRAHSLTWPDPATGARGPYRHPLGLGRFSCGQAFPAASPFQFVG